MRSACGIPEAKEFDDLIDLISYKVDAPFYNGFFFVTLRSMLAQPSPSSCNEKFTFIILLLSDA